MMKRKYVSPSVEVVTIVIERGFAASNDPYGVDGAAGNDFENGNDYNDL